MVTVRLRHLGPTGSDPARITECRLSRVPSIGEYVQVGEAVFVVRSVIHITNSSLDQFDAQVSIEIT